MEYTEGKKVRPKSVWWRSLVLSVGSSLTAGSITRRCCSWGRNDAPSFFFSAWSEALLLSYEIVFSTIHSFRVHSAASRAVNNLYSSIYTSLSLSLTLCVYIYLIIVRTRHPSPGLFWYENLFDPPFNHSSFQFCPSDFFIWRFLPCCLYRDVNISRKREKIQEGRKREKKGRREMECVGKLKPEWKVAVDGLPEFWATVR